MKFYSVLKNEIMSLAGKWMELKSIKSREISQTLENQGSYVFSNIWKLERKRMEVKK